MEELVKVLLSKTESSPGLDGITYSMIYEFPTTVKEKLLQLINEIWMSQDIPERLKEILLVLIPKPGRDPSILESYRPIALLSVYMKVINALIKQRLNDWIDRNGILSPTSYGFVKKRSAVNCVNHLIATVLKKKREAQHIMGVFIDLKDAFNKRWI